MWTLTYLLGQLAVEGCDGCEMIRYVLSMLAVLVAVRAVPEVAKGITFSRTVKDGPGADGEWVVEHFTLCTCGRDVVERLLWG